MTIYIVRHGETAGNARRIIQVPETPLNERGFAQAQLVAQRLAAASISEVLSSDLPRAALTAEAIAETMDAPMRFDPLLQERNFGDLRGVPYEHLDVDPFAPDYVPPAGESWEAFYERVADAWALILERIAAIEGDLAVVTHGLVCRVLVSRHFELDDGAEAPLRFGNTAVTIVDAEPPYRVRTVNCTAHLEADTADDEKAVSGL